ncbi:hypothetical protein GC197_18015 [bacterium]|nr:hypothetical protein [bacterium]
MTIRFQCDTCRRPITVPDGTEGQKTQCPDCYSIVKIPMYVEGSEIADSEYIPAEQEDPLGIIDSEVIRDDETRPSSAVSFRDIDLTPAAPETKPPPASSAQRRFKRACFHFRLASTVVMVFCVISCVLSVVGLAIFLFDAIVHNQTFAALISAVGFLPNFLLNVAGVLWTNEARLMRNLRLASAGLVLSLFPCANILAITIVPLIFAGWAGFLITNYDVGQAFQSERKHVVPE